jgi:hypothetical protein
VVDSNDADAEAVWLGKIGKGKAPCVRNTEKRPRRGGEYGTGSNE